MNNRSVWLEAREHAWLPDDCACADILKDFKTESGSLSVWKLEADESNLDRIAAALTANRTHLANFDYAVFPDRILSELGIKSEKERGETPDAYANEEWHVNLVELTTTKLDKLASAVNIHGELRRFRKRDVKGLLKASIASGYVDLSDIDKSLANKLDK